ncbi:MAG: PorT family protein [Bacteroidales bacterium]|nr:PorT family protein [Bacteroidales bacterium]
MRKIRYMITLLLAAMLAMPAGARDRKVKKDTVQRDSLPTIELVDTLEGRTIVDTLDGFRLIDTVGLDLKKPVINDYNMLGVFGGTVFNISSWNPGRNQVMLFQPLHFGVLFTRYGKMFNYMPYFGIQLGADFMRQGYKFKENRETGATPNIMGATQVVMDVVEIPVMAHMHIDFWKMKLMANVGFFGGYRMNIHRSGPYEIDPAIVDNFSEYDYRFDYGIKAGAGFAFIFDPIEIHFMGMYSLSMSSYFHPDYDSQYYYRFGYPTPITATVGIHYQLTRREGRTRGDMKREARKRVIMEQNNIVPTNNKSNADNRSQGR